MHTTDLPPRANTGARSPPLSVSPATPTPFTASLLNHTINVHGYAYAKPIPDCACTTLRLTLAAPYSDRIKVVLFLSSKQTRLDPVNRSKPFCSCRICKWAQCTLHWKPGISCNAASPQSPKDYAGLERPLPYRSGSSLAKPSTTP